jgi:hypothetical protein
MQIPCEVKQKGIEEHRRISTKHDTCLEQKREGRPEHTHTHTTRERAPTGRRKEQNKRRRRRRKEIFLFARRLSGREK